MKKRILPALLALCMVISLLPVAFAEADATCQYDESTHSTCTYTGDSHLATCPWKCAKEGCTKTRSGAAGTFCTEHTCTVTGCTKVKGHDGAHSNGTCPGDAASGAIDATHPCGASTHSGTCPTKCECTKITGKVVADCSHNSGECNKSKAAGSNLCAECKAKDEAAYDCDGTENCKAPAGTHDHTGYGENSDQPCAKYVACGIGDCIKDKGHEGDHATAIADNGTETGIDKCLGYAADDRCSATNHIAGCPNYVCACAGNHSQVVITYHSKSFAAFDAAGKTCTNKAGCPLCAAWNSYVTKTNADLSAEYSAWKEAYSKLTETQKADTGANPVPSAPTYVTGACTCKDCKPNPAMGAVVDASGETVDPADPKPELPTKVEDFKDADKMDDWMKDAAQVMLDNGWMQGGTDGNFEPRKEAATNMVLTVVARMSGETITGATWADDAKAWAEKNELTEGIEITKSDIARKDIVLMLWRLAGKPESEQALDDFTDVDGLEGDHLTAMKWAVENKIVLGNGDGTVTPDGTLKRAELAVMVARYGSLKK